jgi:hypothetical protein
VSAGGTSAPAAKSGVGIACRVHLSAALHDSTGVISANLVKGSAFLAKAFSATAKICGVAVVASCVASLTASPAEPGSARVCVTASSAARELDKDAVELISVVADIEGDSADVCRLLNPVNPWTLTCKGRAPNGSPRSYVLEIRASAIATKETQAALAASRTSLAHGSPMLVSAPCDGTLGDLQSKVNAVAGPGFGCKLLMPRAHTASASQRVVASPRDGGSVPADLLTLTVWDLQLQPESARVELRQRLCENGFKILPADNLEDLQPGGRWLATLNPRLAVQLTGPKGKVGNATAARTFVSQHLANLPEDVMALVGYSAEARRADLEAIRNATALVSPTARGGGGGSVVCCFCMPSDAALRCFLGTMTAPHNASSQPLVRSASPESGVLVRLADLEYRRRVDANVTPAALHRHRMSEATRACGFDCGAAWHHRGADPAFSHMRSFCGPDGAAVYLQALEAELRSSGNGRSLEMLHLDKPWSKLPQESQQLLLRNADLLAFRRRAQTMKGLKTPKGDADPEPTGSPVGHCVRKNRRGCGFNFSCAHCLLPGHPAPHCVLSPERDRYWGDVAASNRAPYVAALARASPRLFGGPPAAQISSPPGTWNQRIAFYLATAVQPEASGTDAAVPAAAAAAAPEPAAAAAAAAPEPAAAAAAAAPVSAAVAAASPEPAAAAAPVSAAPATAPVPAAATAASPAQEAPVAATARLGISPAEAVRLQRAAAAAAAAKTPGAGGEGPDFTPALSRRQLRKNRALGAGASAAFPHGNHHRRMAIALDHPAAPERSLDSMADVAMDNASGSHQLSGGKRPKAQCTPPRLRRRRDRPSHSVGRQLGGDDSASDDDLESEADRDACASPASAHSDNFKQYFARTVVALPDGTSGPEAVLACLDSVPVPERGGAYAVLNWAGKEESSFGSFDGLRPAQAASDLIDCYRSYCARETPVPDCYYPQPAPGYRRDDVHMGRRSPVSGIARPSTTFADADARLRSNPATPASGIVPRKPAGSDFPGLSRGFLNPAAGKAASPLAAGPAAGSNLRPGKDPGRS